MRWIHHLIFFTMAIFALFVEEIAKLRKIQLFQLNMSINGFKELDLHCLLVLILSAVLDLEKKERIPTNLSGYH